MSSTHIKGNIDFRIGIKPPDNGEYMVLSSDRTISTAWWNGERFISTDYIHIIAWAKADEKVLFTFKDEKRLISMNEIYGDFDSTGATVKENI